MPVALSMASSAPGGLVDGVLRPGQLVADLLGGVEVQPGLVVVAVAPDLVPARDDHRERLLVVLLVRVEPDDEPGDLQVQVVQQVQDVGHADVEVRRPGLPAGAAVGLQVGPLVVEVEGQARQRLAHGRVSISRDGVAVWTASGWTAPSIGRGGRKLEVRTG
jgi:hypothetical protein